MDQHIREQPPGVDCSQLESTLYDVKLQGELHEVYCTERAVSSPTWACMVATETKVGVLN